MRIFVFGSNLAGRHGAGAALHARQHYGAEWGVGEGRTGLAYALPTKDHHLKPLPLRAEGDSLGVWGIDRYVKRFVLYAKEHPEDDFLVTRVGCGLAGYMDEDIAPLFREAGAMNLPNITLPPEWLR